MQVLMRHDWPGNIRELQNVVQRGVTLCGGEIIEPVHLALHSASAALLEQPLTVAEMEQKFVLKTLTDMDGNRTKTADQLGVSLRWLQYRLKDWHFED
jgi:DNA-binding NtrC family response regulator